MVVNTDDRGPSRSNGSNKPVQGAQTAKKKVPVCYTCGLRGHVKKDCVGCYFCGSKGHLKKNCPKQGERSSSRGGEPAGNSSIVRQAFIGWSDVAAEDDCWVIDSGATDNMSRRRDWFCDYENFETPVMIRVGNGDETPAYGKRNIEVEMFVDGCQIPGMIYDVLYVPRLKRNLFSVKVAAKKGIDFSLRDHGQRFVLMRNEETVATGSENGDLYKLNMRVVFPKEVYTVDKSDADCTLQLWHERLCHQDKRHVTVFFAKHRR